MHVPLLAALSLLAFPPQEQGQGGDDELLLQEAEPSRPMSAVPS